MFTGIIEKIGKINSLHIDNDSSTINIFIDNFNASLGDSVCINGVCLTVEDIKNNLYSFSVSPETNKLTNLNKLKQNDEVNIESSLTVNKLISGHIVQGHVDTTAKIKEISLIDNSWYVKFTIDSLYTKYIIKKGSITLDGVSLTVNDVTNSEFSVMIIPHTYQNTIFNTYKLGKLVNVETDVLAKYIEKLGKNND
tara:strand:+ start:2225 stop:2812 length:588 start_codon:yes stop_codon:yes gene_type:complete